LGSSASLVSNRGSIGTPSAAILTNVASGTSAGSLSALSNTGSNSSAVVNITQTGSVVLLNSVSGGNFIFTGDNAITVQTGATISSKNGSITIATNKGLLSTGSNGNLNASGNITLQNSSTASQKLISIDSGSTILAGGNISIFVGLSNQATAANAAPSFIQEPNGTSGISFGASKGLSGTTTLGPNKVQVTTGSNKTIQIDGGARTAATINFAGNTTITAGNAPSNGLDLTNPIVTTRILALQASGVMGGTLQVDANGVAIGGNVICYPGTLTLNLSGDNVPANVTVTFAGFQPGNQVSIAIDGTSHSKQVLIAGTEQFIGTGTSGVLNISSNQTQPVLTVAPGGQLTSDGSLAVAVNGDVVNNGSITAPNLTIITTNNGSISNSSTIGAAGGTTSINASGAITQVGLIGSIQGAAVNLIAQGNIGSISNPVLVNATNSLSISTSNGTAYLNSIFAGSLNLLNSTTIGNFSLQASGPLSVNNLSAAAVTLSTPGSITLTGPVVAPSISLAATGASATITGLGYLSTVTSLSLRYGGNISTSTIASQINLGQGTTVNTLSISSMGNITLGRLAKPIAATTVTLAATGATSLILDEGINGTAIKPGFSPTDPNYLPGATTLNLQASQLGVNGASLALPSTVTTVTAVANSTVYMNHTGNLTVNSDTTNLNTQGPSGVFHITNSGATTIAGPLSAGSIDVVSQGALLITPNATITAQSPTDAGITLKTSGSSSSITIGSSMSGPTVSVTSAGALTVNGPITTTAAPSASTGNLTLTNATGSLAVNGNLTANGGSIQLLDKDTSTNAAQITIGNGVTIATNVTSTASPTNGQVAILFNSNQRSNPIGGKIAAPAGLIINATGSGNVFLGATPAAISVAQPGSMATINATNQSVYFNSPNSINRIVLGNNVTITADPPAPTIANDAANSISFITLASPDINHIVNVSAQSDSSSVNPNRILPSMTYTNNFDTAKFLWSSSVVPHDYANSTAILPPLMGRPEQNETSRRSAEKTSQYGVLAETPESYGFNEDDIVFFDMKELDGKTGLTTSKNIAPAQNSAELKPVSFLSTVVNANGSHSMPSSTLQKKHAGNRMLRSGQIMLAPKANLVVETPTGNVQIAAGSIVFLAVRKDMTAVYNLYDSHLNAVRVSNGRSDLGIDSGKAFVMLKEGSEHIDPTSVIACRNFASKIVDNHLRAATMEFSLPSAITYISSIYDLGHSIKPAHQRVWARLMKNAAILTMLRSQNGAYQRF
jgi:hypothetical protein